MFLIRASLALAPLACSCAAPPHAAAPTDAVAADDGAKAGDGAHAAPGDACPLPQGGLADCTAPLAPGDSRTCTLEVGGVARTYLVYAPASYDPCAPAALVVDAHGSDETAVQQAGLTSFLDFPTGVGSGFRLVADREGFLVVQPQGISNMWTESDTAFMLALPAAMAAQATIDPHRTFMSGISNGGGLTYWTGCSDTGVFAGFGPISGYADATCPVVHPARLVHFHTTTDALVAYSDGQAAFGLYTAAEHCSVGPVASWQFGGAQTDPRALCLTGGPPWALAACDPTAPVTTCQTWSGCDGGATAMFCTVAPDNSFAGGLLGGHVLYYNATHLSLAAVSWAFWTGP